MVATRTSNCDRSVSFWIVWLSRFIYCNYLANPDIVEVELTNDHEFILLACDGIWDVVTNEEAVDFCRKRLADKLSPEQVI